MPPGQPPAVDYSLEKDIPENLTVIKTKIWEPYSVYKKFIGQKQDEKVKAGFLTEKRKPSLAENFSIWIRGNFFIPDARKFWIKPSVKFLTNYLRENPVDAMATTGPPHSMHMIGLGVKKNLGIPWLADFRDPWTNIDFYDQLKLSRYADKQHRKLEQQVLQAADKLITVSWNWAMDFEKLGAKNIEVITNGFDLEDFKFESNNKITTENVFDICHIGSMNKDRNPVKLWETISEICKKNIRFANQLRLTFIGQTDVSVKEALSKNGLLKYAVFETYKPHDEVLKIAGRASVLLLALNDTPNVEGVIPGKLFEYLALQKPILCIGSTTGDSAKIIKETNSGITADFSDKQKMFREIMQLFSSDMKEQAKRVQTRQKIFMNYSRKELTSVIAKILNQISSVN